MKKILLFLMAFVLSLTIAITGAQKTYALELDSSLDFSGKKVTFLGDSLTAGVNIDEKDRWTYIVANELGFDEYVNMGLSGGSVTPRSGRSDSFQERVSSVPTDSDFVFIMGGWNDCWNDVDIDDFETSLEYTVNYIRTNIPNAIIVLMNYFDEGEDSTNTDGEAISDYYAVVNAVSSDLIVAGESGITGKVQILNMYTRIDVTTAEAAIYTYDGLHPSVEGNRIIANVIISYLGGKNIDDSEIYASGFLNSSGVLYASDDYYHTEPIAVVAGKSYVVYANNNSSDTSYNFLAAPGVFYEADGTVIEQVSVDHNMWNVITAPTDAAYMILNMSSARQDDFFVREIIDEFTVEYRTNTNTDLDTVLVGNEAIVEPEELTRTGYTFEGWYSDIDLTIEYDFDDVVSDNLTLYAKWVSTDIGTITVTTSTVTAEWLGLAWYWWVAIGLGAYYFLGTKKGRKTIGLKK